MGAIARICGFSQIRGLLILYLPSIILNATSLSHGPIFVRDGFFYRLSFVLPSGGLSAISQSESQGVALG